MGGDLLLYGQDPQYQELPRAEQGLQHLLARGPAVAEGKAPFDIAFLTKLEPMPWRLFVEWPGSCPDSYMARHLKETIFFAAKGSKEG